MKPLSHLTSGDLKCVLHRSSRPTIWQSSWTRAIMTALVMLPMTITSGALAQDWASGLGTAAATGYCLSVHPYIASPTGDGFTENGFETVVSPGVAGAVRRNYVFRRGLVTGEDTAINQNCQQACAEWGKNWSGHGAPLHVRSDRISPPVPDGVGDLAGAEFQDTDFYTSPRELVTAAQGGRPRNYHESDVAQADFCCCQLLPK